MRDEIEIQNRTKKVEFYQLIVAFLSLLTIIIISVVNINSRITALEIKQIENENFRIEIKNYFNKLSEGQTQILIQLENKTDRK
jgi:hypothetical protein